MSYKPDEKAWMAFLYDELEGDEKEKMEKYLLDNADARKELERFRNLRTVLGQIEEKEVIAPPIVFGESKQRFLWNNPYVKIIGSIAASLILVLLVGKVTDLRMSVSGNEFRLSFGETIPVTPEIQKTDEPAAQSNTLTAEQVQEMINSSLQANNSEVQDRWNATQKKLDASVRQNLAINSEKIDLLIRQAATASQTQISQYVASIQAENMNQVKDYFQLTSKEQKKYIEDILVDFAQYLQQQRSNDLQLVQTQMQSLEQNTNLFKQETEQILTSIISNVGTKPGSGEIKN